MRAFLYNLKRSGRDSRESMTWNERQKAEVKGRSQDTEEKSKRE